jgi:beta-aspartyl-peptidase (threonine type)
MIKFKSHFHLHYFAIILILPFTLLSCNDSKISPENSKNTMSEKIPVTILIHGGAGEIKPGFLTEEEELDYEMKLKEALNAGYLILENGGEATEAVISAIKILEDSPLFNAGRGSVLSHDGEVSMDASIMQGKDLNAGAVSGIKHIKNPILLAQLVMVKSDHVFLSGEGAEEFALENQLEQEANDYFITHKRWLQLKSALGEDSIHIKSIESKMIDKHGTVGCVAIDENGNLAAGTSTGGMVNKKYGRIGDSPIIGAGTFADNTSCAVSATGHGEYFIRLSIARNIADLIKYKGLSVSEASKEVIQNQLADLGGTGGIIAIDSKGNYCFEFNTPGMYRAVKTEGKEGQVFFYENTNEVR